jgi:hypothetical protein
MSDERVLAHTAEPAEVPSSALSSKEKLDKGRESLQFQEGTTFGDPVPLNKGDINVYATSDSDEDGDLIKKNPFLDPDVAERWATVYEKARYECRGQFDPYFTWTEEEEKKLVWKLDWHVCAWAVRFSGLQIRHLLTFHQCVMFFGLQVDRGNLVQAVSDNLLAELNLNTNGMLSLNYQAFR